MELLNIIAYTLLVVFILVVAAGVYLVNKGQNRKHFLVALKIVIILMILCIIGIGALLLILGYYHQF
ncbi:hypothetical protein OWI77_08630 [Staphylococcus nepalensis]|uniref:hypothetical protein n=1 Tax=Staphylococcus nepalensis TaxID=214473 RepID=UPI00226E6A10|nr:hypothetical protein [Staphylococcus nepalensis]MCY1038891.1 hypothetical protein [Staphylococcus nepalensis]